ncbi:CDP-glycerol glycerophosphotransferase family protein [Stenotrophomonas sp. SY1]|uniref:CDP-glycerol glycerophosphotransferase family protein n=1 Tax=Stenotrophomonas sp. SY1 TaxID=477235 RepID=UPI001E4CD599|nr:CDP-glycerol glycerophosphotransferase family protein [Stenotrophomonas sp. SY1]
MAGDNFSFLRDSLLKAFKLPWFAVLSILARFAVRDRNLWLFSRRSGVGDGPLAMALHFREINPALRLVWLTRDDADDRLAEFHQLEFHRRDSLHGLLLCLKAGGGFMTNGFSDLRGPAIWGAQVIQLWHGAPLKRIGRDRRDHSGRQNVLLRRLIDRLEAYWNSHCTYVISASPLAAERLCSAMALPASRVVVTGDPRMDLVGRDNGAARRTLEALAVTHGLGGRRLFAIVAPTWREDGAVVDGLDAHACSIVAARSDLVVFVRAHPHSAEIDAFDGVPNVIALSPLDYRDVTALLAGFDVLLTDYSSIAMDFSVLSRPIVLVAPDLLGYAAAPGLYEDYCRFSEGRSYGSWSDGIVELVSLCEGDHALAQSYSDRSRAMAARYHPFGTEGNAERVASLLASGKECR